MAGLVPAIHVFPLVCVGKQDVDARDKRGHDESTCGEERYAAPATAPSRFGISMST